MPTLSLCHECGAEISLGTPHGLCTRCLFSLGLPDHTPARPRGATELAAEEMADPATADDLGPSGGEPRRLGDYELFEELGRGGMGVVYRARQVSLDRIVAVKVILAGQFASREQASRFRTEAESAAKLQHPNIVAIHGTGEQEGQPYFSMDYVAGTDLTALVRDKPLPPRRAAALVKTLAEAIHYAHGKNVLHRDLKPSNVLLAEAGQPLITDFGLARRVEGDSFLTVTGQVMGSPNFMPPEQAGARWEAGPHSDVYALGGILFYLLTSRPPFLSESVPETLQMVLQHEPVSPRLLNPGVPPDLVTICLKCLAKEPVRRYRTAQDLADDLGRFLADEPIRARPAGRAERAWRWCRRKPALAGALALAGLLLLAISIGAPVALWRISAARKLAELNAYVANVHLAGEAMTSDDLNRAGSLLQGIAGSPAQRGLRGWEWRYLDGQNRSDQLAQLGGHEAMIAGLAMTPDDRWLATISEDGVVKLWDFPARILVASWSAHRSDARQQPDLCRHGLALAPDGRSLVTSGPDGTIQVWDTATRERLATLWSWPTYCTGLAFSPDGHWLGAVAWSGEVILWPWNDGEMSPAVRWKASGGVFMGLSFSPDVRSVALGGMLSAVHRWDISDPTRPCEIKTLPGSGGPAVFLPNGNGLITAALGGHGLLCWDVTDDNKPQRWPGGSTLPLRIVGSPDGRKVAAGYQDGRIVVFDVAGRVTPVTHIGHTNGITGLAFSRDGRLLVSAGGDGTIRLWEAAAKRRPARTLQLDSAALAVMFSPDSTHLASLSRQLPDDGEDGPGLEPNMLRLWRLPGLELEGSAIIDGTGMTGDLAFSPDGRFIAADVWTDGLTLLTRPSLAVVTHTAGHAATFTDAEAEWIYAQTNRIVRHRVPMSSAAAETVIGEQPGRIIRVALSPDRTLAAACSEGDGGTSVYFWDVVRRRRLGIGKGHTGRIMNLVFSPDGRQLATVSQDCTLGLWDVASRTRTAAIRAHSSGVSGVAFAPDGRTLATAGDDGVRLWNVASCQEVLRLSTESAVEGVAFSPNGEWLAAAASDGSVRLWHAPAGEESPRTHNP